ncbi:MAG: histidinol-phosphate transaminase [Alphaproteobacteria bacterium]
MSPPQPRPGLLTIAPYVGGESSIPGLTRVVKLSSNESPFGPSPRAIEACRRAAQNLHRYPDGSSRLLREAIGRRHGLDPARLVCGSGSDELLGLLCHAYAGSGDEVIHTGHGFLMYGIFTRSAGAIEVVAPETDLRVDVDAILAAVTPRTRVVFLANPGNPTGTCLPAAEVRRLRGGLPESVLLVIDAAYAEYVTRADYSPGVDLVDAGANTVMTRTFSKIYGLGGLRLGWAYCPPAVADVLNRARSPFNVNAVAQAAGTAAIEDVAFMERAQAHNSRWLPLLSARLTAAGLGVTDSVANFVLARFPTDDPARGADAADRLLQSRGLIVRRVASYGLPDALRITIGLDEDMTAVADALTEFMA